MLITERDRLREDVMAVAQLTGFNRASLVGPWGTTFTITVPRHEERGPAGLGTTPTAFAVHVATTANTD